MKEGLCVKKSSLLFCSQSFVVVIFIVVRADIAVLFPFVWWDFIAFIKEITIKAFSNEIRSNESFHRT